MHNERGKIAGIMGKYPFDGQADLENEAELYYIDMTFVATR